MSVVELREKTESELYDILEKTKQELYENKIARKLSEFNQVHVFKQLKKKVAQINTILREKQVESKI